MAESSQAGGEREAFEATIGKGRDLRRAAGGDYMSCYVQNDWDVWQARAALSAPPATTEAGDGVLNKAQVCAALANARLMLVKTKHGLRVEKAITGATAYSGGVPPVAAVAQPVAGMEAWDRVLRSSVPERWKGCASPVGAVQSYIAELEEALISRGVDVDADALDASPSSERPGTDAARLVWAMNHFAGNDSGFASHVLKRGGTGDYSDCASFIDSHAEIQPSERQDVGGDRG